MSSKYLTVYHIQHNRHFCHQLLILPGRGYFVMGGVDAIPVGILRGYNILGWMSRLDSDRRNYHLDKRLPENTTNSLHVYVFAKNKQSPYLPALEQELRALPCQYQLQDLSQLTSAPSFPSRKAFVVFCSEGPNDDQDYHLLESLISSNEEMLKVCVLGGKGKDRLGSAKEVAQAISAFIAPPKIKLAGVHAIRQSKDRKGETSRSLKKVLTDSTYQKVFYYKNYKGDYGETHDSAYQSLADALEGEANFEPFKSTRELEKKEALKGKKKYLVLASTNDASIKIMKELKQAKLNYFDFLLLGRLDPREQFLEDSLLLASSDPSAHINFLIENGFTSHNILSIASRLAKKPQTQKQVSISQPFLIFEGGPHDEGKLMAVESPKGKQQEDNTQKKKIRKIKSPGKGRASQMSQISHIEQEQDPASTGNINIVISKHKEEIIVQNQEFRTNKQGEKIYKQESIKETPKEPPKEPQKEQQVIVFQPDPNLPNPYQPSPYQSANYFDARTQNNSKKASNIEAKYRNPSSVIIQEMSDQYRGSNKESIVNLQPEKPKIEHPVSVNQPIEENTGKRVVSKAPLVTQPDTYYINSTHTIQSNRNIQSNRTIDNTNTSLPPPSPSSNNRYASPSNYRVVSATPITVRQEVGDFSSNRVIRKEPTLPEVVREEEKAKVEERPQDKSKEENKITFGTNFSSGNTLNYTQNNSANPYSSYNAYRNANSPTSNSTSNYYNTQTLNYYTINGQPYQSKVQVSTGKTEQIVSPTSQKQPIEENRTYNPYNYLSAPKVDEKGTKQFVSSTIFNNDDYEQIERDGRIIYRKKVPADSTKYNQNNYASTTSKEEDGSPAVKRYEPSPVRKDTATIKPLYSPTNAYTAQANTYTLNSQTTIHTKNIQTNPVRREPQITYGGTYDYGKALGGSTTVNKGNLEIITVPYNKPEEHLGEMIESSHKKKASQNTTNNASASINDGKKFVTVSYRNEDRSSISNKDNGVRVYGVAHPRVDVERVQVVQPKVNAPVPKETLSSPKEAFLSPKKVLSPPNPKPNTSKLPPEPPKAMIQASKPKAQINAKADLSPIPKNTLNQSNWFSRMSQLHSDGSILRRNNIRFGVKLQKREERVQGNSVVENKLVSGIYKVNDLNKKMALNRIIQGEEYIQEQREKYAHINPSLNRFHLLLQEDMEYLQPTLQKYLSRPHDRIDQFAGVHSLFSSINTHSEAYDLGFIFAREEEMAHINPTLLPEHYFLVSIEGEQGLLEISEAQRKVRVDQLKHFPLVQRIILDSQLYQYVAYRNNRPQVELLADKFVNSEFILEKIETEFTTEILDCYYYELPRLTRLYVLCDEQELPGLLAVVQAYSQLNPAFKRETCKLVCVLSNILANDQLIMAHPTVTFISNPEEVTHFRHILGYAHHYDPQDSPFLPIDHIFYHNKHAGLDQQLAKHFPGRFQSASFARVAEVYPKVQKLRKAGAKEGYEVRVYLVLHENVNAQKIRVQFFSKIFMLGKAKVVQNKVVRVMNTEELMELLTK